MSGTASASTPSTPRKTTPDGRRRWRSGEPTFGLYIHRLETWRGADVVTGTVRFELIGTPVGEARAGIDRAFFRMTFERAGEVWLIRGGELVQGDRSISSVASFQDVGGPAGIAFENRYYPPFINEPMKFGMLRYGPAGITAADYDGDGHCDLFIPDGVESRLFRNLGDGAFNDVT